MTDAVLRPTPRPPGQPQDWRGCLSLAPRGAAPCELPPSWRSAFDAWALSQAPCGGAGGGRGEAVRPGGPGALRPSARPRASSGPASLGAPRAPRPPPQAPVRLSASLPATLLRCGGPGPLRLPATPPRRVLTAGAAAHNDGRDTATHDLILAVGDALVSPAGTRYVVAGLLGAGTFGQVARCRVAPGGPAASPCAVKVIKNHPAYHHQARVELGVLQLLNGVADPGDAAHIVRLTDSFVHARHLCLVFELLHCNLYELLRGNSFRGLPTQLLRLLLGQLLTALTTCRRAGVIHCDIKARQGGMRGAGGARGPGPAPAGAGWRAWSPAPTCPLCPSTSFLIRPSSLT